VRSGRCDSIVLGIENRDPITDIVLVMKCKLVSVIAMCAGSHAKRTEARKVALLCGHHLDRLRVLAMASVVRLNGGRKAMADR
jgi:hypothetical protein